MRGRKTSPFTPERDQPGGGLWSVTERGRLSPARAVLKSLLRPVCGSDAVFMTGRPLDQLDAVAVGIDDPCRSAHEAGTPAARPPDGGPSVTSEYR